MLILCFLLLWAKPVYGEQNENDLDKFLPLLFSLRTNMLMTPNPEVIDSYYNRNIASSDQAY